MSDEFSQLPGINESGGSNAGVTCVAARSALHYHDKEQPTRWDLNVYRGCTHGCRYCFARYSHDYIGSGDFFGHIVAKTNLSGLLHRELSRSSWKKEAVNLGGVSDSYQKAEASMELMPEILKIFIHHSNPVLISTKSDLILRDASLFAQLSLKAEVRVAASIITSNDYLASLLEPGASPPSHRFAMLKAMKQQGIKTYILLMPVLPYLTDTMEHLEAIYQKASKANVDGILAWPLNLRGQVKPAFISFLREHFPALVPLYIGLYDRSEVTGPYLKSVMEMVAELRGKYGIGTIPRFKTGKSDEQQMSLF